MRITIDTSHDSKEDIKKAIEFLSRFLETPEQGEFEVPEQTGNVMQMFDSDKKPEEKPDVHTYDI